MNPSPSKIRINLEDNVQYVSMRKALKVKRPRFDVSLVYLTRKFMDLVRSAPGGILDLNKVATKLGVRKRRVYDITNVLDGIDLVEKKSKNHIRWIGSDLSNFGAVPQQKKLQEELSDLSAMEDALDELIKDCAQQLFELTDDKENERLAYVTYQDIHSIQAFHEQIVIAVKAPAETRLDVPAPREVEKFALKDNCIRRLLDEDRIRTKECGHSWDTSSRLTALIDPSVLTVQPSALPWGFASCLAKNIFLTCFSFCPQQTTVQVSPVLLHSVWGKGWLSFTSVTLKL
eukprot:XP_016859037.1 transcription factor E2F6 isoform X2 [Homo sapiens]